MYKTILKPILFRFDPEFVHNRFTQAGIILGKFSLTRKITDLVYGYRGKDLSKVVDGIKFRTPFLLSAGFDYNAQLSSILPFIGFGGEEVGSVTSRPCKGNPKPRLTRLPQSRSIIVNKGLRNDGVEKIIKRLKKAPRYKDFVVGVSIARSNDKEACTEEEGIKDYVNSFKRLNEENVGDYYTINISCPNAFGGESFTKPEPLDKLLYALEKIPTSKPVYVKMPINLSWQEFQALLDICDRYRIAGVIIGNLNKDYSYLKVRDEAPSHYRGGLSGEPCRNISTELIRNTRKQYGNRFTIIGVGGVMSPEAAREKFEAGADLIQLITGMIYEGPGLIRKLCCSVENGNI